MPEAAWHPKTKASGMTGQDNGGLGRSNRDRNCGFEILAGIILFEAIPFYFFEQALAGYA